MAPVAGGGTTGSTRPTTRSRATWIRASASTCSTCSAAGGIAAYLQPTADLNPILRATTLPARPTDRLYVDRTHLEAAREHLNKVTGGAAADPAGPTRPRDPPESTPRTTSTPSGPRSSPASTPRPTRPPTPWPAAEGIEPRRKPSRRRAPPACSRRPTSPASRSTAGAPTSREPSLLDGLDDLDDLDDDDDDERYTPPPPPPLPHISKYAVIGVLGVVLGFVLFLFPGLLPIDRDYADAARLRGDRRRRGDAGLAATVR